MDEQRHRDPRDAEREGVAEVRKPHHPTTEQVKAPHPPIPPIIETPGEKHRAGPLPNEKK